MNFVEFLNVFIGLAIIYFIFFPLKWFDDIFRTEWGNSMIDKIIGLLDKKSIYN